MLGNAADSSLDEVILVLGHEAASIRAVVGDLGQRTIINPNYDGGQSTSLRAGVAAVNPRAAAALFLLGDQPGVGPTIIDALLEAFRRSNAPLVIPTYGGQRGNPVLIARPLFSELALVTGDEGARGVVRAHVGNEVVVPIDDAPPPKDVDTEEDYASLLTSWDQ